MPWDRKRLLGYVETIQLILGVTDKFQNLLITIILKGSDFFISYLSYWLHCRMLPDKRYLSHGMCLYQVVMT